MLIQAISTKGHGPRAYRTAMAQKFIVMETDFREKWSMGLNLAMGHIHFQMATFTKDHSIITKAMAMAS